MLLKKKRIPKYIKNKENSEEENSGIETSHEENSDKETSDEENKK